MLFRKKRTRSLILIDIRSGSVGGAYAHYVEGAPPVLYYSLRTPLELRTGESRDEAMLRTLHAVTGQLVMEGAPQLRREVGRGDADTVLVSVGGPWQESEVLVRKLSRPTPFVFTRQVLEGMMEHLAPAPGRTERDISILTTSLDGRETEHPFGKRVQRASVTVLSSTLDQRIAREIEGTIRRAFHAHSISITAMMQAAQYAFQALYPHQQNYALIDLSAKATDIAFIERGLLAGVCSVPHGSEDEKGSWLKHLGEALTLPEEGGSLPHTLFLLSDEDERERFLTKDFRKLWPSSEPLSVIAVKPSQFSSFVKTRGLAEGDSPLGILALSAPQLL